MNAGDLVIDSDQHRAFRAGVELELSEREFALLLLFVQRQGETLTRTLISEQIWNIHFDPGGDTIDIHINKLRMKVDDPWDKKLIKTVRGIGYMLAL